MESIGYLISKSFILVAADTNFEFANDKLVVEGENIKKVFKLNDRLIISVIGTIQKISDIIIYLTKLSELGDNKTYDETLENLKSLYSMTQRQTQQTLISLMAKMDVAKDADGMFHTDNMMKLIADDADMRIFFDDVIDMATNKAKAPTCVMMFGVDESFGIRYGQYLIAGHYLTEVGSGYASHEGISAGFASSTLNETELLPTVQIVQHALEPLLREGWEDDQELTAGILSIGKEKLAEGLAQITPYHKKPEVVFYELSSATENVFREPEPELEPIILDRAKYSSPDPL